ncbi:MAG: glycosyltransferase, partial [Acidobacteriaceae bacterium]|nr:glycosyltransferase [Acidobacteriaceae bacterium]
MKILFLSPRQCWPPLTGAKLREYHLARALGKTAALTHVSFTTASPAMTAAELPFCKRVLSVPRPAAYRPDKIARGLLGRWPLPVLNYTSREMKRTLTRLLDEKDFDLVHFDSLHLAAYLPLIRHKTSAPVVLDWHNVESELMSRFGANSTWSPRKLYAQITARRLADLEKRMLREAAGHVVCSARDRDQLDNMSKGARIAVVENGVAVASFQNGATAPANRCRLVFVGSMDYHANIEAATSFTRDVWPVIRERFPAWQLTLAGSNPAPAVQALASEPNVEVTGTVPDVRPYYAEAFAAIVPLLTGGGTRLKILEAMAAGVPVVSTSLGAEGLAVSPGSNILIADTKDQWLPLLESLSFDPGLWLN